MSKLRAAISFKHRVDEVKTIQQQKLRENIAGPILNIDDSNLEIQENPTNLENHKKLIFKMMILMMKIMNFGLHQIGIL